MGNSKIIYGDKVLMDLSGVTVAAIPYTEAQNAAGGTTVTIAPL